MINIAGITQKDNCDIKRQISPYPVNPEPPAGQKKKLITETIITID